MIGAVIGDIVGSIYEGSIHKPRSFPLLKENSCFTDDSVLTIAVAGALLECKKNGNFVNSANYYLQFIRLEGKKYPDAVYIGGDTDTTCCIAGGIGAAFYKKIDRELKKKALNRLHNEQKKSSQILTGFLKLKHKNN